MFRILLGNQKPAEAMGIKGHLFMLLLFQRQPTLSCQAHTTDDDIFIQAPFPLLPIQTQTAKLLLLL